MVEDEFKHLLITVMQEPIGDHISAAVPDLGLSDDMKNQCL
jgi:hypothetical protein